MANQTEQHAGGGLRVNDIKITLQVGDTITFSRAGIVSLLRENFPLAFAHPRVDVSQDMKDSEFEALAKMLFGESIIIERISGQHSGHDDIFFEVISV